MNDRLVIDISYFNKFYLFLLGLHYRYISHWQSCFSYLQFEGSTDTNSQYELEKIHGDIDKSSCGFSNSSGDIDRLSLLYFSDPELLFGRSETRYVHLFSSYFPTCSLFCLSIGIEFEAVQPVAKRNRRCWDLDTCCWWCLSWQLSALLKTHVLTKDFCLVQLAYVYQLDKRPLTWSPTHESCV